MAGDGRRGKHGPVSEVDGKDGSSGFGVDGVEKASVGRCEVDFAVGDSGRRYNPGTFVGVGPKLFAGGGVERIKIGITAAKVDDAVSDSSGRLDALLIVNVGVFAGFEAPFFFSG